MNKLNKTLLYSVLALGAFQAHSQTYNFDDGSLTDTTGQTTLVPFNIFGSGQIPAPASGTISAADGVLNLSANHFGMGTAFDPTVLGTILGPTRVGVVNPVPYEDFEVSMIVTDPGTIGDGGTNPWILLGARLTDVGPGTTKGYAAEIGRSIDESFPTISLQKIENEVLTSFELSDGSVLGATVVSHNENSQYKIVFTGKGSLLTVYFDNLSNEAPGIYFSVNDDTYTAGVSAVLIAAGNDQPEVSISSKIDDFVSRAAPVLPTPPALTITETVLLTWPLMEGNFILETALKLDGVWYKVPSPVVEAEGELRAVVPKDYDRKYFRLRAVE